MTRFLARVCITVVLVRRDVNNTDGEAVDTVEWRCMWVVKPVVSARVMLVT
jgi:hypothetical protein